MKSYSIGSYASKCKEEFNFNGITEESNETVTELPKRVKQHAKAHGPAITKKS